METEFWTVAREAICEVKIQRSLFIGHALSVASEDEARRFISAIRDEHSQAAHNCYAYRIGLRDNPLTYFNDHGEPAGTAGRPILNAILQARLTNTVMVVTRYFGGKKLGVRGLIDAYHGTAAETLQRAGKIRIVSRLTFKVRAEYSQLPMINRLINQYEVLTGETEYGARVALKLHVPEKFREEFREHLSGLSGVEWLEGE